MKRERLYEVAPVWQETCNYCLFLQQPIFEAVYVDRLQEVQHVFFELNTQPTLCPAVYSIVCSDKGNKTILFFIANLNVQPIAKHTHVYLTMVRDMNHQLQVRSRDDLVPLLGVTNLLYLFSQRRSFSLHPVISDFLESLFTCCLTA